RAVLDAAECPSRFKAPLVARDRFAETFRRRPAFPFATSRRALDCVFAEVPFFGGSFTPDRRAFESPIAIACLVERAPCLPSRTSCISSRTNSPAWVVGDFPSAASSRAASRASASVSGCLCVSAIVSPLSKRVAQEACQRGLFDPEFSSDRRVPIPE